MSLHFYPTPPVEFCVIPNNAAQYAAVQYLVSPHDVAHLFDVSPGLPYASGDVVAEFLREARALGYLRYIGDCDHCNRWSSPLQTLFRGGGHCAELSILALSALYLDDTLHDVALVTGWLFKDGMWKGHAWCEGIDSRGWFLIECTTGEIYRNRSQRLPLVYRRRAYIRAGSFQLAA